MVIAFRPAALVFRALACALIATGLVRLGRLLSGAPDWRVFLFYTAQSNVVCLAWMLVLLVVTAAQLASQGTRGVSAPSPRLAAAVMMTITVTMGVYLVLLAPNAFQQSGGAYRPFGLTSDLVHIVAPCLIIADWLAFTPKGRLRWFDPLMWTIPPYAYLVFAFTRIALGADFGVGRIYPYPFKDIEVNGLGGVVLWIGALSIVVVTIGYGNYALDRLLAKMAQHR